MITSTLSSIEAVEGETPISSRNDFAMMLSWGEKMAKTRGCLRVKWYYLGIKYKSTDIGGYR
jgi:hypothetical protein